jgi:diaminohydroxyphosphoribosylaminopyrimidine deaminase/5-amino-6-(5-phosphoribosylamino)uracil reductase
MTPAPAPEIHFEYHMARALKLAERALGHTSPNPMVGAILLTPDGHPIGEGWHHKPGQPHAEIMALNDARAKGNGQRIPGSTMVVTLEPCCHQGRTGPCTKAIIEAGISTVVVACTDPNPRVSGRGIQELRTAGIRVILGVLEQDAQDLNAGFFTMQQRGRPLMTIKWAMTLDGRLSTETGQSKWITGTEARNHVHQWRARHDAILVGSRTVLADDPELSVRLAPSEWPVPGVLPPQPRVIIVDGSLRTPPTARCIESRRDVPVSHRPIIVTAIPIDPLSGDSPTISPECRNQIEALRDAGCFVISLPSRDDPNHVDLVALATVLGRDLGICSVYCEGGGQLQGHLMLAGLVDRVHAYMAFKLVAGVNCAQPLQAPGAHGMGDAVHLERIEHKLLGPDLWVGGWIGKSPRW